MTPFELTICFATATCAALGQSIAVSPGDWYKSGFELTPYASPNFSAKLMASPPPSSTIDMTALYPFSFFITNTSGHKVLAYSASWTSQDASGKITRQFGQTGSLRSSNLAVIPNGADSLVMPIGAPPSALLRLPQALANFQDSISRTLITFGSKAEVTASLEAVVLDDGLALGPDTNNAIPRLRAQTDAQKTLASEILAAFDSGGNQAVADMLNGIAADPRPKAPPLAGSSSPGDVYAAFLAIAHYNLARSYANMAAQRPDMLIRMANREATETYLVIHR